MAPTCWSQFPSESSKNEVWSWVNSSTDEVPKTQHKDPGSVLRSHVRKLWSHRSQSSCWKNRHRSLGLAGSESSQTGGRDPVSGKVAGSQGMPPRLASGLWPLHALSHTNSSFSRHGTNCVLAVLTLRPRWEDCLSPTRLYGKSLLSKNNKQTPQKFKMGGMESLVSGVGVLFPISPIKYN